MSVWENRIAAKNILGLVRSCPEVKFFITAGIMEELRKLAPESFLFEIGSRTQLIPRGFVGLLRKIVLEDDRFSSLRGKSYRSTLTLIHETLLLRRTTHVEDLLKLLKSIKIDEELMQKYGMKGRAAALYAKNLHEYEEARKEAVKLLECFLKNAG